MAESTRELLRRAAKLVGRDNLATALSVSQDLLQAWIDGQVAMPARKLTALGDYLEEITLPPKQ